MAFRSVALLRAINVGGNNRVKMADLVGVFDKLGFTDIATYVQSGNVVFSAKRAPDAAKIEAAFAKHFGFASSIVLRDRSAIEGLAARNPFPEVDDHAKLHVIFAHGSPGVMKIKDSPPDRYHVDGREAFVHYRDGAGTTKLKIDFGVPSTARNWRTVLALVDMM